MNFFFITPCILVDDVNILEKYIVFILMAYSWRSKLRDTQERFYQPAVLQIVVKFNITLWVFTTINKSNRTRDL